MKQPKPGPEVLKLAYYLGTRRGEGQAKDGPFGPGGKRRFLNIRGYDEKTKGLHGVQSDRAEASVDGGPWTAIAAGKVTKVQ
jgi:hypothetical protein